MDKHDMKGFLSFMIIWMLSKKSMNGAQISKEFEKRRGSKPSPGTIYPALKDLKEKGLISCDDKKVYSLTKKGEKELKFSCAHVCEMFYDIKDMSKCCE